MLLVTLPKINKFEFLFDDYPNNRGKRLVLRCDVSGSPKPTIEFQKDGVTLRNDSRLYRKRDSVLHIENVTYQNDEGLYRCVATNDHGKVFEEKEIRVPSKFAALYAF